MASKLKKKELENTATDKSIDKPEDKITDVRKDKTEQSIDDSIVNDKSDSNDNSNGSNSKFTIGKGSISDNFKTRFKANVKDKFKQIKAHKSEIMRFVIVLLILIVLYFSSASIFHLRSSYAEQIMIEINPQYDSLVLRQGESENIVISTEIRSALFCTSYCEYSFIDLSNGEVLVYENFTFSNYRAFLFEKILESHNLGSGQELYLFEINCVNYESRMCSATPYPIKRNSLITLNHEPSLEQELSREELRLLIDEISNIVSVGQTNKIQANIVINNLAHMKKNQLEYQSYEIEFFETYLIKDLATIRSNWETQNYSYTLNEIRNNNVMEKSLHYGLGAESLMNFVLFERTIYNEMIDYLSHFENNLFFYSQLQRANRISNNSQELIIQNLHSQTLSLHSRIHQETFNKYEDLNPSFILLKNETLNFSLNSVDSLLETNDLFYELISLLSLAENDLCLIEGNSSCNNILIREELMVNEQKDIDDILAQVNNLCLDLSLVNQRRIVQFENKNNLRLNLSNETLVLIDLEKLRVEESMIQFQLNNLNNFNNGVDNVSLPLLLNNYSSQIPMNNISFNYYPINYDNSLREFFLPATYLQEDILKFMELCTLPNLEFPTILKQQEEVVDVDVVAPQLNIINDVSAVCCFDSNCVPCCDYYECKSNLRNPIIVLHGYSFYGFNSAIHSANAFSNFETHALNDNLYYPAGIIGPNFNPDYVDLDLTRSFVPPLFKATYYDVVLFGDGQVGELSFRTNSLHDYATRLHELVELVKQVTGKEEVDIVAHSMGGLVTRTYIDKYGDESLGKIILVGTPNSGVPPSLVYLCRFFGGQTECDEMHQNSSFMQYLNNEASIPKKEVHMLIGKGCSTFGADGDGVVQTQSAELDYAIKHYFEGSCDLIDNFHRDMIKPSRYPEIYNEIIQILLS